MKREDNRNLIVKFPENAAQSGSTIEASPPNNTVEKAADFLPRALVAVKENFKESVFLSIVLGYAFIAAFGHMEKFQNYVGFFSVFSINILIYKFSNKVTLKDIFYILIIIFLLIHISLSKFDVVIPSWL